MNSDRICGHGILNLGVPKKLSTTPYGSRSAHPRARRKVPALPHDWSSRNVGNVGPARRGRNCGTPPDRRAEGIFASHGGLCSIPYPPAQACAFRSWHLESKVALPSVEVDMPLEVTAIPTQTIFPSLPAAIFSLLQLLLAHGLVLKFGIGFREDMADLLARLRPESFRRTASSECTWTFGRMRVCTLRHEGSRSR